MKRFLKGKKLIGSIFVCLTLFMVISFGVKASDIQHSGKSGELKWTIDTNGHFILTGNGDYDTGNRNWEQYKSEIKTAEVNASNITNLDSLFMGCENLESVDLANLETSKVTNMYGMFWDCKNLKQVDFSNFNTKNVTCMTAMFLGCNSLTEIDLSVFDTSKVTDMSWLFTYCDNLVNVNVQGFDTVNTEYINNIFSGCTSLKQLDLSSFDLGNAINTEAFIEGCYSLISLKTPVNLKHTIYLPVNESGNWHDESGNVYEYMPQYLGESILLTKENFEVIPEVKTVSLNKTVLVYNGKTQKVTVKATDTEGNKISSDYYTVTNTSNKDVGVYAVTVTFKGKYSGEKTLEYSIVPKKPASLTAERFQYGNKIKLTWEKSKGATGYRIAMKKPGASSYTYLTSTTKLTYTKADLTANKKYTFKVTPYYKPEGVEKQYCGTEAAAYRTKEIATVAKGKKISKTGKPTVKKSDADVKVSWKNVENTTGYEISQSTSKTATKILDWYYEETKTSGILPVVQGKKYYYKVRAYRTVNGKKIYGEWSDVTEFTANTANPLANMSTKAKNIIISASTGKGADYFTPTYKKNFTMTAKSSNPKVAKVEIYNYTDEEAGTYSKAFEVIQKGYGSTNITVTVKKDGKTYTKTVKYTFHKYENPFSSFKIGAKNYTSKLDKKYEITLNSKDAKGKVNYKLKKGYKLVSFNAYTDVATKALKNGSDFPDTTVNALIIVENTKLKANTAIWLFVD